MHPYVVLQETGVRYTVPSPSHAIGNGGDDSHRIFYDEGAGLLHIVEGRMVSAVDVSIRRHRNMNKDAKNDPTTTPLTVVSEAGKKRDMTARECTTPRRSHHIQPPPHVVLASPARLQQEEEENEERGDVDVGGGDTTSPPPPITTTIKQAQLERIPSSSSTNTSTHEQQEEEECFLVSEGPPVMAVCTSLNGAQYTALQRSPCDIEFICHSTQPTHTQSSTSTITTSKEEDEIKGFFWTDAINAEFVVVTAQGLRLYTLTAQGGVVHTAF